MKHNAFYWVAFVLLALWQLPQTLIGLLFLPFVGKKRLVADGHYNLCYEGELMTGGVSLGSICIVSPRLTDAEDIAHEFNGHTVDSRRWGWLYLLVIGIPSLLNTIFLFAGNYYDFYTERWANDHAGLKVRDNCQWVLEFTSQEAKDKMQEYLV